MVSPRNPCHTVVTRECELPYRAETIQGETERPFGPAPPTILRARNRPGEAALGMAALHRSVTSKITARYVTKA